MKKKRLKIIFVVFSVLCFCMIPSAQANDYVTYGDIMSSFQAYFNGGLAIQLIGENEINYEHLPAIIDGKSGQIWPFDDDVTYRYEDAHGLYTSTLISENDLIWLAGLLGITYDENNLNEACKDMMDRFNDVFILDGVPLETISTPYKRTFILDIMGSEALWWNSEGILYKPKALVRGSYNLIFYVTVELANGMVIPIPFPGYYSDITFHIV